MDIKVGQVYRYIRRPEETMEITEDDNLFGFFKNWWKCKWSDGKKGITTTRQVKEEYSLDDQWVVGEILRKYCKNDE